jgi:hypothetical protein
MAALFIGLRNLGLSAAGIRIRPPFLSRGRKGDNRCLPLAFAIFLAEHASGSFLPAQ